MRKRRLDIREVGLQRGEQDAQMERDDQAKEAEDEGSVPGRKHGPMCTANLGPLYRSSDHRSQYGTLLRLNKNLYSFKND